MPQYLDPGYAATTAMEDFLARREAAQFAREKFEAEEARHAAELRERQEESKARREDLLQRAHERDVAAFEKRRSEMVKGDVMDPEMRAQAVRLGYMGDFKQPIMPEGHEGPMPPGQEEFMGTREERLADQARQRQKAFVETLPPGSPERRALEAESVGLKVPPKFFGGAAEETQPVMRVNPRTGQLEQIGTAPKGAHYVTEPAGPDPTAAADRSARRMDALQEHFIAEFKKNTDEVEASMREYGKVGAMLNQRTSQADADLAPLILKATVGGMGSGFRMTQAEINNTLHGRTKWEDLKATLNKWSIDPQHFTIPEEQREAVRALSVAIRKKGYDLQRQIMDMRLKAIDVTDPKELLRMRAQLHINMYPPEDVELSSTTSPEGLPEVGGMFRGSKVLGIREKK